MYKIDVAESIFGEKFTTGRRINTLTAHAQTLLSCLKQASLDRLRVLWGPSPNAPLNTPLPIIHYWSIKLPELLVRTLKKSGIFCADRLSEFRDVSIFHSHR